jgi:hypothetical protein
MRAIRVRRLPSGPLTAAVPSGVPGLMSASLSAFGYANVVSLVSSIFRSLPSRDFTDMMFPSMAVMVPRTRAAVGASAAMLLMATAAKSAAM